MLLKPAFRLSTALNIDIMVAPAAMTSVGAILVAFLVDHFLGEPPARLHPVVWTGKALSSTGAPWEYAGPAAAYLRGAGVWVLGAAASAATAWAATAAIRRLSSSESVAGIFIQAFAIGVLLKPLLAWRMLHDEVANVERALESGLE